MPERQLGSLYWQLEDQWVAPTWAGIEYDGRWKMLHYAAKDIYEPVIIAPFFNRSSGELTAYVTSSLWEKCVGNATFTWYDWQGQKISVDSPVEAQFEVGALNTTQVLAVNITNISKSVDLNDTVLRLEIEADGIQPNTQSSRIFRHENWFHPAPLNTAKLVDPGLQIKYDNKADNFTVTATSGLAAWVFVDYPSGAVLNFDSNAFWLAANESRELSYKVKYDETDGRWKQNVTARSIWDLTTTS